MIPKTTTDAQPCIEDCSSTPSAAEQKNETTTIMMTNTTTNVKPCKYDLLFNIGCATIGEKGICICKLCKYGCGKLAKGGFGSCGWKKKKCPNKPTSKKIRRLQKNIFAYVNYVNMDVESSQKEGLVHVDGKNVQTNLTLKKE